MSNLIWIMSELVAVWLLLHHKFIILAYDTWYVSSYKVRVPTPKLYAHLTFIAPRLPSLVSELKAFTRLINKVLRGF